VTHTSVSPTAPPFGSGLRSSLGLEPNVVVLLATVFLMKLGEELWVGFVPKYLEALGGGALVWTAYQAMKDLLDAVYQYPGGLVSDRLGRKRALVFFTLLAIAGYALYLMGRHWGIILFGTLLVAAWGSMSLPATFAVIGDSLQKGRRSIGFSLQSIAVRVPVVVAPALGGWLLLTRGILSGFRVALGVTIVLAVLALVVLQRLTREQLLRPGRSTPGLRGEFRLFRPELRRLLVSDVLARLAEGIPAALFVIYATTNLGASIALYGALRGLQMLVSILCYVPAGKLADRIGQAPFIALTLAFFALFPLSFALYPLLSRWGVVAFLTLASLLAGLREIGEPARKSLIVDLVDQDRRGQGVGAYYLARGLCVAPAPLLGGALWLVSPGLPFAVAAMAGVAGLGWYLWKGPRPCGSAWR
jgi:DHA1 family multidrug resistance protein-like MFS transporter